MKAILKKIRNCIVLMIKGVAYDYDVNDKVIHVQYASGEESWYKYDDNGNMINLKFANGSEWWYEYDINGNRIYEKNSAGSEYWHNAHGKMIRAKWADGSECRYDCNGDRIIYGKESNGLERWYEYDDNMNLIHVNSSSGYDLWHDACGNMIQETCKMVMKGDIHSNDPLVIFRNK